ncbi:MAG: rsmA [Chlamydiales bacterium]|jgi:16S rRNA (adenine1518-N6/adenine1519-N6)-dimethyltransferase|nr:rsmA [Chlamydiales bacterium]
MGVANLNELLTFLNSLGTRAKKHLSQNFLIDQNILNKIVDTAQLEENDIVLEIGAGPGALSEALLKTGATLIAVEKDPIFAQALNRFKTEYPKSEFFCDDICTFDIAACIRPRLLPGKKAKVIANLPYQLTSPILAQFLPLHELFSDLIFMVQEEVAQRIVAPAGSSEYSSLSLFVKVYSEPFYAFKVSHNCFHPKPKVDSAIVKLKLHEPPAVSDLESFFKVTRTAFQHRRKMLRSSLSKLYSSTAIKIALGKAQLPETTRPEEITLTQFITFFEYLRLPELV